MELLAHPLVLKAAWTRVEHWYRGSDLVPQPEFATWKLHPESEIRNLSKSIRTGQWKPSRWLQAPYPKKGSCLRHYVLPTVKDQVAFMAHMVLLGPSLDERMEDFVFGNRWYRPVRWDSRKKTWIRCPYPFYSNQVYLPYARSHGLYRRVANWTVRQMTKADLERHTYSGVVQLPEDYDDHFLPPWVHSDWWESISAKPVAYWSTLDIRLAYPSVRLKTLKKIIRNILKHPASNIDQQLSGYPLPILNQVTDPQVCLAVANHLLRALHLVDPDPGTVCKIPNDAWKPRHLSLPDDNEGLPTGLAISGLLLNVALHSADSHIYSYLSSQDGKRQGAFLRFADDMTLLSRSTVGLFDLIEEVWKGICGDTDARLDEHKPSYALFLNVEKTGPDSIREVLKGYLRHQGWDQCDNLETAAKRNSRENINEKADTCEELLPPSTPRKPLAISKWWKRQNQLGKEHGQLGHYSQAVERSAVGPGEVGPFVTTLVERLSAIGKDTLGDRFGEGAQERLVQLHDLARFNIADEQVRPDTRRAFAVNRLVSAWLSSDTEEARVQLKNTRDSVAKVVQETPWKFALWRAVVRAAARRPPLAGDSSGSHDDATARTWLLAQLRKIATEQSGSSDGTSWHKVWPEVEPQKEHTKCRAWQELYLSFVRAAFWNALADTILLLQSYHYKSGNPRIADAGLSPAAWVARAIPDGNFDCVANQLSALDQWARALYSKDPAGLSLEQFPWELDSLVTAVLASRQRTEIARAWLHSLSPGNKLMVPEALGRRKSSLVFRILEHSGRIQTRDGGSRLLDKSALASVLLGARDGSLGDFLFPKNESSRIHEADDCPKFVISAAKSLGCIESVYPTLVEKIVPDLSDLDQLVPKFRNDPLFHSEYGLAREFLLRSKPWSGSTPTLQRLLWGIPTEICAFSDWQIRAWEIPAIGLPTRVAAFLFRRLKRCDEHEVSRSSELPTTWKISADDNSIALGRMLQFDIDDDSHIENRLTVDVCRTHSWEVPPHPAYFLPYIMNPSVDAMDSASFTRYCDVLTLLTAMDGGESILRSIADRGVGAVPFAERWDWRSRIHLSEEVWKAIEQVTLRSLGAKRDAGADEADLERRIRHHTPRKLRLSDFLLERIDLLLDTQSDGEVIRAVRDPRTDDKSLSKQLILRDDGLSDSLSIRIGQIATSPSPQTLIKNFPRVEFLCSNRIMEEVYQIFYSTTSGTHAHYESYTKGRVDLIVFPELAIPVSEVSTVRRFVERTGRSSIAGLYWRELSPVFRRDSIAGPQRRWFVNEAELVMSMNHNAPGPNSIRWYRVRKTSPAHREMGLAKALSMGDAGSSWQMLKGRQWYRFLHPHWGDFSIAICADLLDPAPWRSLRGELSHLLMVAYNKDIELYQSLTWIRAYENYVNLVAVNHGRFGGSFIWTPQRSHAREVATLRGRDLLLFADVDLPVKDLIRAQRDGVSEAVERAIREWVCGADDTSRFKSPPPGFLRRSI